jgi:hypothetical protein
MNAGHPNFEMRLVGAFIDEIIDQQTAKSIILNGALVVLFFRSSYCNISLKLNK